MLQAVFYVLYMYSLSSLYEVGIDTIIAPVF